MADLSHAALAAPPKAAAPPLRPKYRIRFRKAGDLRLVSHHDLLNCFERMFRRASLPLAVSQGFHPKPKLVFALSLALGVVGQNEVLELELTQEWTADELLERLRRQAPPGIEFHSVRRLVAKSSAQVRRAFYLLKVGDALRASQAPCEARGLLCDRIEALLCQPHLWIERARPQPRRIDVRPFISELRADEDRVAMAFWVTPHGTARPEEIAHLLGLDEILASGVCIERSDLEMLDESPDGAPPMGELPMGELPMGEPPVNAPPVIDSMLDALNK